MDMADNILKHVFDYSFTFSCVVSDFGHPVTIKNGNANFTSTLFKSTLYNTCDIGYNLIGDNTTTHVMTAVHGLVIFRNVI